MDLHQRRVSAPALIEDMFAIVERWDSPLITLTDRAAVELFLRGRGLPRHRAEQFAGRFPTPLDVTRRGALIWAT